MKKIGITLDSDDVENVSEKKSSLTSRGYLQSIDAPITDIKLLTDAFLKKYKNVPYVLGGGRRDVQSLDCSSLVFRFFKENFSADPGLTTAQFLANPKLLKVEKASVLAGDIIMFENPEGTRHCGVIAQTKPLTMLHIGSRTGVSYIDLEDSSYWKKRLHPDSPFLRFDWERILKEAANPDGDTEVVVDEEE